MQVLESDNIINEEFKNFCEAANLSPFAYPNIKENTISVSFELDDIKFNDCFTVYHIFLVLENSTKQLKEVQNKNKEINLSHTFKSVTCGEYIIYIQPCYNGEECAKMVIRHNETINMSSSDCFINSTGSLRQSPPFKSFKKDIIIGLVIASVILIITIGGSIYYYYYWSDKTMGRKRLQVRKKPENCEVATKNIHVYILHYYDRNDAIKGKVRVMKDYFSNSSCFASVRDIEDELAFILYDVNGWLDSMLRKENTDGSIKKIILIDTGEYEDEEYELDNLIYSKFIEKLSNDISRCLTDYNNLFVVKLDGITTYSEKLKNVVKRDRYHILRDLNDLCLNLCSISTLDTINA